MRCATLSRATQETAITISLNLDGTGQVDVHTGVGFFDHMLSAFGRHGLFDLKVQCEGDLEVDAHHTVEDVGIVLGDCFAAALGSKESVTRFAQAMVPMDEALVLSVVDISGRGELFWDVPIQVPQVGNFDTQLGHEFFAGLARNSGITLHMREIAGENAHHILEACFKAAGRALRFACELDSRVSGIPSTKGSL